MARSESMGWSERLISLQKAILENDLSTVKFWLRLDLHLLDVRSMKGNSFLMMATEQGYLEIMEYLLSFDPNLIFISNLDRDTPLHIAIRKGNISAVKLLLRNRSWNLFSFNNRQETPFYLAARWNQTKIFQLLIQFVRSLTQYSSQIRFRMLEYHFTLRGPHGNTCLHIASRKGNSEIVRWILHFTRSALTVRDASGYIPLHIAIMFRRQLIVEQLLLAAPEEINALTESGQTVIHLAIENNFPVSILIPFSSFSHRSELLNLPDSKGSTPLHWAANRPDESIIESLLVAGANSFDTLNCTQNTPVQCAARSGNDSIVERLLWAKHQSRNDTTKEDRILWWWDLDREYESLTTSGISLGRETHIQTLARAYRNGWRPLHFAAFCGHESMVNLLMSDQLGPWDRQFLNQPDKFGRTPLHLAAYYGWMRIVRKLLRFNLLSNGGDTPLHLAVRAGHSKIVDVLLRNGYPADSPDSKGWTAFDYAFHLGSRLKITLTLKAILGEIEPIRFEGNFLPNQVFGLPPPSSNRDQKVSIEQLDRILTPDVIRTIRYRIYFGSSLVSILLDLIW